MSEFIGIAILYTNYEDLSSYEKFLLVVFGMEANSSDYSCSPSLQHLAKVTSRSKRSIQRSIDKIIKLDYITKQNQLGEDGSSMPNKYVLNKNKLNTV